MMLPALLLAIAGATRGAAGVTPIEKVVTMLYDLQEQVESDGDAEAETYNTFACFCKDKTDEKTTAIGEGEGAVDGLQADLDAYSATRDELDGVISELQADLNQYNADHKSAHDMRKAETATFDAAFGDMTAAIAALKKAVAVLKASETSFVQVKDQVRTLVEQAVLTADALGLSRVQSPALTALLAEDPSFDDTFDDDFDPDRAAGQYDFKSGDIIGTLESLQSTFEGKLSELESDDAAATTAFDGADTAKKAQIAAAETSLENNEKTRSDEVTKIAAAQSDLTVKSSVLNDDRLYLQSLAAKCETKSKEWGQRSAQRTDEIAAITQALTVIEGDVSSMVNATANATHGRESLNFLQGDSSADYVSLVQRAARKVTSVPAKKASLVATRSKAQDKQVRSKLVALFRKEGALLKSPALVALAMNAAEDPFAKVKEMIQGLITRLLEEEADEANHKGWCDTEMAKVKKDREYRLRDLNGLHAELEGANSRKGVLTHDEMELTHAIGNLTGDLATEEGVRNAEKAENAQTVSDSAAGVDAVTQALDILAHYYGEAAQATVNGSFLQATVEFTQVARKHHKHHQPVERPGAAEQVDAEAPPTADGAYVGGQSAATGILALLDVIKGDFERTISSTEAAETQAKRDFIEFERDTKVSIKTKETALTATQTELTEVGEKLTTDLASFRSTQELLDTAVQTWTDLLPQCVADPGMSPEERVQARESELAALKEAYCILNDEDAGCSGVFLQKRVRRH